MVVRLFEHSHLIDLIRMQYSQSESDFIKLNKKTDITDKGFVKSYLTRTRYDSRKNSNRKGRLS